MRGVPRAARGNGFGRRLVGAAGYGLLTAATLAFLPWLYALDEGIDFLEALRPFYPSVALLVTCATIAGLLDPRRTHAFFWDYLFDDYRRAGWITAALWAGILAISMTSWYFMQ